MKYDITFRNVIRYMFSDNLFLLRFVFATIMFMLTIYGMYSTILLMFEGVTNVVVVWIIALLMLLLVLFYFFGLLTSYRISRVKLVVERKIYIIDYFKEVLFEAVNSGPYNRIVEVYVSKEVFDLLMFICFNGMFMDYSRGDNVIYCDNVKFVYDRPREFISYGYSEYEKHVGSLEEFFEYV